MIMANPRPLRYEDCLIGGEFFITTLESARLRNAGEFRALEIERDKLKLEVDRGWLRRYCEYFCVTPPLMWIEDIPINDDKGGCDE